MFNFWSVNCWSAKYTVHFFLETFIFLIYRVIGFKKGWEDHGAVRSGPSGSWTIQSSDVFRGCRDGTLIWNGLKRVKAWTWMTLLKNRLHRRLGSALLYWRNSFRKTSFSVHCFNASWLKGEQIFKNCIKILKYMWELYLLILLDIRFYIVYLICTS